jgi:hypothetical protein
MSKESVAVEVAILKADTEERYILGEVLVPEELDADNDARKKGFAGDIYSADEIRKAAHGYMERSQFYDLKHQLLLAKSQIRVVESYIAPVDFELTATDGSVRRIKKGTWLLGSRVLDDQLWNSVKSGELMAYSIMGSAKITEEEFDEEV